MPHRTVNSARFPSFSGEADHCSHGPLGTPDSLVRPGDHLARATRRPLIALLTIGTGGPLAHRTVR
jgi:hypothetical protein